MKIAKRKNLEIELKAYIHCKGNCRYIYEKDINDVAVDLLSKYCNIYCQTFTDKGELLFNIVSSATHKTLFSVSVLQNEEEGV